MKRNNILRLISIIILIVVIFIIVIMNKSEVDVWFIVPLGKPPVIVVIFVSLLIGYILGLITYSFMFRGNKKGVEEEDKIEKLKKGR